MEFSKYNCQLVKTEYFENCLNKKEKSKEEIRIQKGFEEAIKFFDFDLNKSPFLI